VPLFGVQRVYRSGFVLLLSINNTIDRDRGEFGGTNQQLPGKETLRKAGQVSRKFLARDSNHVSPECDPDMFCVVLIRCVDCYQPTEHIPFQVDATEMEECNTSTE
jgi:hypothetical protein